MQQFRPDRNDVDFAALETARRTAPHDALSYAHARGFYDTAERRRTLAAMRRADRECGRYEEPRQ